MKKTTRVALAKRTLEKVTEAFEEFLKPKAIRLFIDAKRSPWEISRLLGIPIHICERWITKEVKHLHDEKRMNFTRIGEVMNRKPWMISQIYYGSRFPIRAYSNSTLEILEDD